MLKQINSLGSEKITPDDSDIIPIQQADGITRHITRENFLAGISNSGNGIKIIQLLDSRSSGTNGGSFIANAWTPRTINTKQTDDTGLVTLSANTFVLPPGTYWMDAKAYFYYAGYSKMRLHNISDDSSLLAGMTVYNYVGGAGSINSMSGLFTISAAKNLQMQYRVNGASINVYNLGDASNFGANEVYASIDLFKLG